MPYTNKSLVVPMLIMGSMFTILGFALGINAFFVPFMQDAFDISITKSYLVMTATFISFVIFGMPSAAIIKKYGYKGGIIIGLLIMAFGFYLIIPSVKAVSFSLLLLALLVSGMGQALLTGATNTYVTILGSVESAASRIALMGICSKTFYALASLTLAFFMDLNNVRINDTILPFQIISGVLLCLGFLYYFMPLPDLHAIGEEDNVEDPNFSMYANSKTSAFQFPHLLLGVVAIFFDIGVEYIALGTINDYAAISNLPSPENYVWFVSAGMVVGYILGVMFIPKLISQRTVLILSASLGILVTMAVVLLPIHISIYMVAILGLANALMWPAIWPLAITDLGKFTKNGSSLLVTGIIGGGILPLIFGYVADLTSHQFAYIVSLPAYLFIIYYALYGSKIRTKPNPLVSKVPG